MAEIDANCDSEVAVRHMPEVMHLISSPVVELRQYTLKPGRRDELITLFENHFIEGQEQYGMQILGQFRRRTAPDQLVWLRGFPDMNARRKALEGFYFGPIWQEHRTAANDTMLDSDNVLLLKPVHTTSGLQVDVARRPAPDAQEAAGGIIIATVYTFNENVDASFVDFFEMQIVPVLCAAGASLLGYYVTETAANTFPQLPVRDTEYVFIWFSSFANEEQYAAYQTALAENDVWTTLLCLALQERISGVEEVLELIPTRRSLLRH